MRNKDPKEFDLDEKGRIAGILKKHFDLNMLTDEVLFFSKSTGKMIDLPMSRSKEELLKNYYVHNPDGYIKTHEIVVEIDGNVHWQNTHAVKNTNKRNQHYGDAKLTMLWFTRDEVKNAEEDFLVNSIKAKLGLQVLK